MRECRNPIQKENDKQKDEEIKALPSKVGRAITTVNVLENKDKSCP